MKVLVLGSGGREHALVWKIAKSDLVDSVLAAPGSAAMSALADCRAEVGARDIDAVVALASREEVDLVVVGPEDPLADGIADRLRATGVAVFGPSAAAAQLEGSKAFAKAFMDRHGIPTAAYAAFDDLDAARKYVRGRGACVVKADGLAAGKGVFMCETPEQAESALGEIMADRRFGDSGAKVVIEEWLRGEEASYYAISDGHRFVTLAAAQDHKRALDGDQGENTGGMGAYSPAPVVSSEVEAKILHRIVEPTIRGMREDGHAFQGVLFVGLMIDAQGDPQVIEFNVRFGDPETQALMARLASDIVPLLAGAAAGDLSQVPALAWGACSVCVVLASEGYPRSYPNGCEIQGLDAAGARPGVVVFHAGTRRSDAGGFETSGGRVIGVTASGTTVKEARDLAYAAVGDIEFEGVQFRHDIAARALDR